MWNNQIVNTMVENDNLFYRKEQLLEEVYSELEDMPQQKKSGKYQPYFEDIVSKVMEQMTTADIAVPQLPATIKKKKEDQES